MLEEILQKYNNLIVSKNKFDDEIAFTITKNNKYEQYNLDKYFEDAGIIFKEIIRAYVNYEGYQMEFYLTLYTVFIENRAVGPEENKEGEWCEVEHSLVQHTDDISANRIRYHSFLNNFYKRFTRDTIQKITETIGEIYEVHDKMIQITVNIKKKKNVINNKHNHDNR